MKEGTTRLLSISAVFCSLVALGLSLTNRLGDRPETSEALYLERIDELEREISGILGNAYQSQSLSSVSNANGESASADGANELQGGSADDVEEMRWVMTIRGLMPATEEHIKRSRMSMYDDTQDAKAKVSALRVLRRADQLDDDIVRQSIAIFHSTDDPRVQEDILELVDGVTTPELAPTLLQISAEHIHYRVRRQALDAMSGFLPDPELDDWLRIVIENDGSRQVREKAAALLDKYSKAETN